jgi:hypothetical protein
MRVLYLDGPGPQNIRLTKDGVELPDGSVRPPFDTGYDTIIVANTKGFVSYSALKALGKFGVTLALLGKGGTPLATFIPWNRNDAPLRIAQMRAHLDPKLRLTVARALVEAKTGAPLGHARTIEEVRQQESILATEYWGQHRSLPTKRILRLGPPSQRDNARERGDQLRVGYPCDQGAGCYRQGGLRPQYPISPRPYRVQGRVCLRLAGTFPLGRWTQRPCGS